MAKRFAAIIIIANFIMGLLLYLSAQEMLLHLAATHPVSTLTGVNIDKIYIGAVQGSSSTTPLVISPYPNYPFYVLWLPLIANAYFIAKTVRSSGMPKKFPIMIVIANIMMSLLTYFSIETLLLSHVAGGGNYTRIWDISFWSYSFAPVSVGGSVVPQWVALAANLPSFVFLLFVIVNACFTVKLLISKLKQPQKTL